LIKKKRKLKIGDYIKFRNGENFSEGKIFGIKRNGLMYVGTESDENPFYKITIDQVLNKYKHI